MKKCQKGFTLIELIIVIIYISIISIAAFPKWNDFRNRNNTNYISFYEIYNNGAYTYSIRGNVILDSNDGFVGIEFNEVSK